MVRCEGDCGKPLPELKRVDFVNDRHETKDADPIGKEGCFVTRWNEQLDQSLSFLLLYLSVIVLFLLHVQSSRPRCRQQQQKMAEVKGMGNP